MNYYKYRENFSIIEICILKRIKNKIEEFYTRLKIFFSYDLLEVIYYSKNKN